MKAPFYSKRQRFLLMAGGLFLILFSLYFSYLGKVWAIPVGCIGGAVFTTPIADWYYFKRQKE